MKKVLGFLLLLVSIVGFSQTNERTVKADTTTINEIILQRYCNDFSIHLSGANAVNLYSQKSNLHLEYNGNFIAVYNASTHSYYYYTSTHKPNFDANSPVVVSSMYNPNTVKRDSFNPYGATSLQENLVLGTINYFLKRGKK